MSLPFPDFFDPREVATLRIERAAQVAEEAALYAKRHSVKPAGQDKFRIAAFGIDAQVGFCTPGASLFVPGAVEDTQRTLAWLYANLDKISQLTFSLDTHLVFQIFHPAWWVDADGNHPPPFSVITANDVRGGRWRPVVHEAESREYVEKLDASGKYVLTIWPYHTLQGGVSHALVPALREAVLFHAIVRGVQPHFETKGTHPLTENYSVMAPEVRELGGQVVGAFNAPFFRMLMEYDRVYVFGQAKSHCVLSTLRDMAARDPKQTKKIWILEDATSPVPPPPIDPLPPALDFPRIADQAFDELRAAGMHLVKTTDPIKA